MIELKDLIRLMIDWNGDDWIDCAWMAEPNDQIDLTGMIKWTD